MQNLEFKKVSKTYMEKGQTVNALQETSFVLRPGEFVALIGPSGSGKSTLLTLLGGLQKPTSGEILLGEEAFSSRSSSQMESIRLREIGFILQASNLVPYLTLLDQLRLVSKVMGEKFDKEKACALLDSLGILKYKDTYPEDLSGGERQRAAIARALFPDPTIVLADEPTASLDTKKAFDVVQILADETKKRNKICVMVTHDERLLSYVDRVFVITDGKVEERNA